MKRIKFGAAILGGCLSFLSYPEINLTFLLPIAYLPYLWLLNRCNGFKETFLYTWLHATVMTLGGFFWIAHTAVEFGGLPWVAAIPIVLLYAAAGSINLAVTGGLVALLRKRLSMKWQALWVTAVFVIIEAIFPKLFYWYAGNALYQILPLLQIADIGGAIMLTTLILWINYAIFALLDRLILPRFAFFAQQHNIFAPREASLTVGLGAGFLAFSMIYGHWRMQEVEENARTAAHKNIGVVQGNIGNMDRLLAQFGNREAFHKMAEMHRDLTLDLQRRTADQLDLVLWPEGAYPYPFPNARPEHQMLANLTAQLNAALVTGGNAQQREPELRYFNAMILLEPGQPKARAIYKKHILLAFGEYVPLSNFFPVLKNVIPAISDFGAGPGPEILAYQDIKAAAVICYEILDPHYLRAYAQQGANIMLNVTNDSWFGKFQEPEQHLALAQLRCVETRKVQVRSTNTGISAIIWPNGEITHRTPLHEPAAFAANVPLMEMPPTLYTRWGDWWAGAMALIVLGLFAGRVRKSGG